jgi:hypothetical protein
MPSNVLYSTTEVNGEEKDILVPAKKRNNMVNTQMRF